MWVALLRAVNLGARNKVPMAQLRTALEGAGHENVRTLLASGNVVLDGPKPSAAALERLIADAFGVETRVFLRSARQLRELARAKPFAGEAYVAFTAAKPPPVDGCVLVGWDLVFPRTDAASGATLEKHLGIAMTVRNWRTVERLAQLVA